MSQVAKRQADHNPRIGRHMRLRGELLLLLAVFGILFALIVGAILFAGVLPVFQQVERDEALGDGRRVAQSVQAEIESLRALTYDYSVWDDIYAFVVDRNTAFVAGSLTPETVLANLSLDVMQIYGTDGAKLWGAELADDGSIVDSRLSLPAPGGDGTRQGVVATPRGLLLMSTHAILTSTGKGPPRGWLVMGRLLNEKWIARMSKRVDLPLRVMPPGKSLTTADRAALVILARHEPTAVEVLNETTLGAYASVPDFEGKIAVLLRADLPRHILHEGWRVAKLSAISAMAALLFLGLCLVVVIDRLVAVPLTRLTGRIQSLAPAPAGGNASRASGDEVAMLTHAFQDLMAALDSTQQRLRTTAASAEEANRAKSMFLATMTHEIRTPLNGVVAMAELLERTPLTAEQNEMSGIIRDSANTLLAIINDILDFSKIEAGRLTIENVRFSLSEALKSVVDLLAPRAAEKKLDLIAFVDPAVPDDVVGDPVRVRQLFTNLIGNAIKFTEKGHVAVRVRGENIAGDRMNLVVEVADTGIGIGAEQIEHLFKPFAQAESSTTRRFGGTGLGLSICRALLEKMGGRIDVDSTPGQGSVFRFDLPLAGQIQQRSHPKFDLQGRRVGVMTPCEPLAEAIACYVRFIGGVPVRAGARIPSGLDAVVMDFEGCRGAEVPHAATLLLCRERDCRLDKDYAAALSKTFARDAFVATLAAVMGLKSDPAVPAADSRAGDRGAAYDFAAPSRDVALAAGALMLVVEDNATNRTVIGMLLSRLGYAADFTQNGFEALAKLKQMSYGMLLTDCHMPVMDGYELSRSVRQMEAKTPGGRRLPIVALTADTMIGTARKCRDAGMDDCLTKPVARATLDAVLGKYIPQAHALRRPVSADAARRRPDAAAQTEDPSIDLTYLVNEVLNGARGQLKPMLGDFLAGTETEMTELFAAIDSGDLEETRKVAHAIKGAARMAGAKTLSALAGAIESAAKAGERDTVATAKDEIIGEHRRVKAAVAELPDVA